MPYVSKNRKMSARKSNKTVASIAKKVVQQELKKVVEQKYFDYSISTAATTAFTAYVSNVMKVPVEGTGTNFKNRIGAIIYCKGIQSKWFFTSTVPTFARLLIFLVPVDYDRYQSSDLSTQFNALTYSSFLPRADAVDIRYRVLVDQQFIMDPDRNNNKSIKKYIKINKKVSFDSDSTDYPNNMHIHSIILTSDATASSKTTHQEHRLSYTDM